MLFEVVKKYKTLIPPEHINAHLTILNPDDNLKKILPKCKMEKVGIYTNIKFDFYATYPFLEFKFPENKYKNKRILIEHTSANPTKSLHLGHIRNAIIGDTLARILRKMGAIVHTSNYVDDTGLQVAQLIYGLQEKKPDEKFDRFCDKIYVEVNKLLEENPEIELEIKKILKELENRDSEYFKFAQEVCEKVLIEQLKTLEIFDIKFDFMIKESSILEAKLWDKTFEILKEKGLILYCEEGEKQGCWVFDLSLIGENDFKVIVRSDGTVTYVGKDIAFALWKVGYLENKFKFKKFYNTYLSNGELEMDFYNYDITFQVIGEEQKLPQKIIKYIVENLTGKEYIHYAYGLVALSKNTAKILGYETDNILHMSGRKGIFIRAEDLYEKILERVKDKRIAKNVIKYEMLKHNVKKLLVFDLEDSLKTEGNTGVYITYTYARAKSVLEKIKSETFDKIEELNEYEDRLFKTLIEFYVVIKDFENNLQIHNLTNYLFKLCNSFNSFYQTCKISGSEIRHRYLLLVKTIECLEFLFDILGLDKVEKI